MINNKSAFYYNKLCNTFRQITRNKDKELIRILNCIIIHNKDYFTIFLIS